MCMGGCMDEWMDRGVGGWMGIWMDGWMNEWRKRMAGKNGWGECMMVYACFEGEIGKRLIEGGSGGCGFRKNIRTQTVGNGGLNLQEEEGQLTNEGVQCR